MANSNFVVQNGLQVGPLTIDAATGSISTTGSIASGSTTLNQIFQSASNVIVSNSTVNVAISSTNVASFSATGLTLTGNLSVLGTTTTVNQETINTSEIIGTTLSVGTTATATTVNAATMGNIGANHVGTGTYLTSLNASNLSSGTVPSAQISGSYTGITAVGTIATGTWNGSVIGATYGGTGVNNGSNTLTLSGSYTLNQSVAIGASPTFGGTNFSSIPNGALTNSSVTVTAGSGLGGGGAVSLGGSVTLTNAGVTSAVAGTAISVSGATGAVTINNTGVTSAVAGTGVSVSGATGAVTISIGQAIGTSATPTFAGITVPSITHSGTSGTGDIGASGAAFGTVWATATSAKYADLAENYQADRFYNPGTVLQFGGTAEVTMADADTTRVAGVVSTNPAHLMNGGLNGANVVALALQGRVPCMIIGPVAKGDLMVSAGFGYAKANNNATVGQVIGKALEDFPIQAKGVIEVVVGRF